MCKKFDGSSAPAAWGRMRGYSQLVTLSSNLAQSVSRKGWLSLALGWNTACSLSFSFCPFPGDCQLGPAPAAALLSVGTLGGCICAGRVEGVRAVQGGIDAGNKLS